MNKVLLAGIIIIVSLMLNACTSDETSVVYDNTPYSIEYKGLPTP